MSNVHAMLGSIVSCMLTFTGTMMAYNSINPETIKISKIERLKYDTETFNPTIEYDISFSAIDSNELECMTKNIYFEARNQKSDEAMAAVGYTVLNRMHHPKYPNTICGVVYQGQKRSGEYVKHRCQFSWVCDGESSKAILSNIVEKQAWERAEQIALAVLHHTIDNPIGESTMYHATYVSPYWKHAYERVAQIEDHIFYQKRG